MSGYEDHFTQDVRLAILAELARQNDGSLNALNITRMVDAMAVRRPREWVEMQLRWLADMGAVALRTIELAGLGKVVVATVTAIGRDHVEQRIAIPGISAPRDLE